MNVTSIARNASGCGLLNSYAIARVGLTMMIPGRFYQRLLQQQLLAASIVVLGLAGAHAQNNDNITALPPVNVAPAEQPPPLNVAPAEQPPPQVLRPSPRSESGPASQNASRSTTPCKGDGSAADKGFGCLNQKLKNQVDQANSSATTPTAPFDAKSSDLKVGVVNVPGVQQQYGKNFGVSAAPYRPPMAFGAPLGRH
jgi:hypothetical protein